MKTRDQIYRMEAAQVLRDLSTYHHIRQDQLLRLYPGKESKIQNLLTYFCKQGRIFHAPDAGLYHDGTEAFPDQGVLAALWVLIDFIETVEYHSAVDYPAALVFISDGDLYEVIHVPADKEYIVEHAMAQQGSDAEKRIVIVEVPSQIPRLNIPNAAAYCTVDMDTGRVEYYRQEAADE